MRISGAVISLWCWGSMTATVLSLSVCPPQIDSRADEVLPRALPSAPMRLAIYPPLLASYLTIDGTSAHVLAVSEAERKSIASGLFGRIFPSIKSLSVVPADPEQMLLLAPDKIIAWSWAPAELGKVGIPIERMDTTDLIGTWKRLGQIAQRPERADDFVSSFIQHVGRLIETIADLPVRKDQHVIIVWRNGPEGWNVASSGHRQAQYLKKLGAAAPPEWLSMKGITVGNLRVGVETLLNLDPDTIFLSCCAPLNDNPQTFYSEPVFQALKAVQNRRVYKQPSDGTRMDALVEWPLLLRWYAELLYSCELGRTFRDDFTRAYSQIYGITTSDDELNTILFMNENSLSANYWRFTRDVQNEGVPVETCQRTKT